MISQVQNVYLLGIGGIGMSGLAQYFRLRGCRVSGYDRTPTVVTDALQADGIEVFFSEDPAHLNGQDLIIYTPAIKDDNAEFRAMVADSTPYLKRSQVLGEISKTYKTIAVAGTHGKTSTSTLLTHLLRSAGVDCTAFLGGISANLRTNFCFGHSEWLVVEADEFDRSFLTLHPEIAIINSVDADHLDIYGTHEEMIEGYLRFAGQVRGALFVHTSIAHLNWGRPVVTFGEDEGDIQLQNLRVSGLESRFDIADTVFPGGELVAEDLLLHFPGRHNAMNAAIAHAVALRITGTDHLSQLAVGMSQFAGIYRRFEVHLHNDRIAYVDDYAHHPTEIAAAIDAARGMYPMRQLVVAFQPHLYTRTRDFADGFAEALAQADALTLLPIYPAREQPIPGVETEMLQTRIAAIKPDLPIQLVPKAQTAEALAAQIKEPAIVLTLGAGDIDKEVAAVKHQLQSL